MSISANEMESALDDAFKKVVGRVPIAPCVGAEKTWQEWTDQDDADLNNLIRLGFTSNEVARALQRTRVAVWMRANGWGLSFKGGGDT